MPDRADIARYRANFQAEVDAASTYRALAEIQSQPPLKEIYQRMAAIEEGHIGFWEEKLKSAGAALPPRRPSLRARFTSWAARYFGAQAVLPALSAVEQEASHGYDDQPEAKGTKLSAEESSHARILRTLAHTPVPGLEGGMLARLEGRHRAVGGNALRAAVLGANDGLCSTLSLVMGVAGAGEGPKTVMIAGLAGMLAGASAMAMGEWLSVQSSRELAQRQIAVEADELAESPEEEMEELALIYQAKGLPLEEAQTVAARLIGDKDKALDTLAREELGLDPEELGGSAWEAAITSFILFVIGAIAPVTPFIIAHAASLSRATAIIISIVASGIVLFLVGATITLLTGRGLLFSGLRQLLFGAAAAALTYGIGHVIGVAVG